MNREASLVVEVEHREAPKGPVQKEHGRRAGWRWTHPCCKSNEIWQLVFRKEAWIQEIHVEERVIGNPGDDFPDTPKDHHLVQPETQIVQCNTISPVEASTTSSVWNNQSKQINQVNQIYFASNCSSVKQE